MRGQEGWPVDVWGGSSGGGDGGQESNADSEEVRTRPSLPG